jgi:hypothetical protein
MWQTGDQVCFGRFVFSLKFLVRIQLGVDRDCHNSMQNGHDDIGCTFDRIGRVKDSNCLNQLKWPRARRNSAKPNSAITNLLTASDGPNP